jgi:hypothetical protein
MTRFMQTSLPNRRDILVRRTNRDVNRGAVTAIHACILRERYVQTEAMKSLRNQHSPGKDVPAWAYQCVQSGWRVRINFVP